MITILGAAGLIGSRLCKRLTERSIEHYAPDREDAAITNRNLGNIIYCIGVTADFRSRTFDTVEAHVCNLLRLLRDCDFDSLLYLSSCRLYSARGGFAREEDKLVAAPLNPDDLYNLSKALGESLALNSKRKVRIARISNVYGDDFRSQNFLSSVIRDAVTRGEVIVRTSPDSEKDYIHSDDVVDCLIKLANGSRHEIYNIASGENVSNQELMDYVSRITGCSVVFEAGAPTLKFPKIDIERVRKEFDFHPSALRERIDEVVQRHQSLSAKLSEH
jgi:nucleoside-diphosphate-sugar epimerase